MEGKFPSKILAFVTVITHNCDSFFCWSQIFHILSSICEGFILPSLIRFFERAFWVRHKFLIANRHFFCSVLFLHLYSCAPYGLSLSLSSSLRCALEWMKQPHEFSNHVSLFLIFTLFLKLSLSLSLSLSLNLTVFCFRLWKTQQTYRLNLRPSNGVTIGLFHFFQTHHPVFYIYI